MPAPGVDNFKYEHSTVSLALQYYNVTVLHYFGARFTQSTVYYTIGWSPLVTYHSKITVMAGMVNVIGWASSIRFHERRQRFTRFSLSSLSTTIHHFSHHTGLVPYDDCRCVLDPLKK